MWFGFFQSGEIEARRIVESYENCSLFDRRKRKEDLLCFSLVKAKDPRPKKIEIKMNNRANNERKKNLCVWFVTYLP